MGLHSALKKGVSEEDRGNGDSRNFIFHASNNGSFSKLLAPETVCNSHHTRTCKTSICTC